jgi:hypothetical protein
MTNTEFVHALLHSSRTSSADNSDLDASVKYLANSVAVLRIECFGLNAIVGQVKTAVRKNAINIKRDEADVR